MKSSEIESKLPYSFELIVGLILVCIIHCIIALFKMQHICILLFKNELFSYKMAKNFKAISFCAFSEAIIFFLVQIIFVFIFNLFFYALTVLPTFFIVFISLSIGVLMNVLSNVFFKAIKLKEENDSIF